ncbi:MAG: glycosyltransferase family 9 protein [Gammaproteobacteria bacterium]|nr:glycosyltransferase family 9 protein [Gammaproteobacteria bacterium]
MTEPNTPSPHIAIVRFSALGDVIMVAAAIRALRREIPGATITWITSPLAFSLLEGLEGVNFAVMEKPNSLSDYRAFYKRFAQQHFDVVLAMQANLRINLLYPALRAPLKIGFDRTRARELQWLFSNRRIPFADSHLVDSFLAFVTALTGKPAMAEWGIPLTAAVHSWAKERLSGLPRPLVVLHPVSSKAERNWLPAHYAKLISQAVKFFDCGFVITGGNSAEERALCEQLAQVAPRHTLNLCGQTTTKQLAAVLDEADALIAPDTAAVHMARAVGTPVIGLYAVAPSRLTGPYQQTEYCVDRYPEAVREFLGKDAQSLPWNTRVHHPGAMALIEVGDVLQQLTRVLGKSV